MDGVPTQPLSFEEVLNLHERNQSNPAVRGMSLPDFSSMLNEASGSELFSAGLHDSRLKRASIGFDRLLKSTGVPQAAGELFANVGEMVSPRFKETARGIGEGLPRTALEMLGLPLVAAGGPITAAIGAPLLAAGVLSSGARAYTATDSPAAGIISGGSQLLMPYFGKLGATYLTGAVSKALASPTGANVMSRIVDFAGHSLGQSTLMELANQASSEVSGHGFYNPFTPENLFTHVAGQVAFAPLAAINAVRGPRSGEFNSIGQELLAVEKAQEAHQQVQAGKYLTTANDSTKGVPLSVGISEDSVVRGISVSSTQGEEPRRFPEYTFMGRVATTPIPSTRFALNKRSGAEIPILPRAEIVPQQGILQVLQGRRIGEPKKYGPQAIAYASDEVVTATQKMVTEGEQGVGTLVKAGDLANVAAQHNGELPPVTDASLQAQVAAHLDMGLNEQEAVARITEGTKSIAVDEAVKLTAKQQNEATANERLAGLPDIVKNFLGEGIVKVDRQSSADAVSDLASNKLPQAALNWLDAKQPSPEALADPAQRAVLAKDLDGYLQVSSKKTRLAAGAAQQKVSTTIVDTPSADIPTDVTPFTKLAAQEQESQFHSTAQGLIEQLVSGEKPFTAVEATQAGLKVEQPFLNKATAVVRDIALGGTFGDVGGRSKKGFRFTPSEETLAAFGGAKPSTVQKFVTENWDSVRKLVEQRMEQTGTKLSVVGPLLQGRLKAFLLDEQPILSDLPGYLPAVRDTFFDQFRFMGHAPDVANTFADVAMKVASSFRDIDRLRIAVLVDRTAGTEAKRSTMLGLAVSEKGNSDLGIVGINFLERMHLAPPEFATFAKLLTLGHETYHAAWNIATTRLRVSPENPRYKNLIALNDLVEGTPIDDRRVFLASAFRAVVPDAYLHNAEAKQTMGQLIEYAANSPQEFIATYAGLTSLGMASGTRVKANTFNEFLAYADKQYSDFSLGFYHDLTEITGALTDITKMVKITKTEPGQFYEGLHSGLKELMRTRQEIQSAVDELSYMAAHEPGSWLHLSERGTAGRIAVTDHDVMMSRLRGLFPGAEERNLVVDYMRKAGMLQLDKEMEKQFGKTPNWFEGNFAIPAHLRELYPSLNDVTRLVMDFRGDASNTVTRAMTPFGRVDKLGRVVFDKDSPIVKVRSSPTMEKAVSEIFLEQNWNKAPMTREGATQLELFPKLSEKEQELVWQSVEQTRESMSKVSDEIVNHQRRSVADALAGIILHGQEGMKSKTAIAAGERLAAALEATATKTPDADMQMVMAAQGIQPEVLARATQAFQALYPKFTKLQETLKAQQGFYTPETRLGDYYLRYVKDGKRYFVGFDSKEKLGARLESLRNDETVEQDSVKAIDKYQRAKDVNTLYSDIVGVFTDVEKSAYEISLRAMAEKNPEMAEVAAKLYQPGEATFQEIATRGFGKHFQQRQLVGGREEINMMQGVVAYIEGMSMGMSKAQTKRRAGLLLMDPEMKQNPDLRHLARDYVTTVTDPPAREWTTVKNMGFQYYLGANPTSVAVEAFQPMFSLAPELTRQGAGVVGGYKLIGEATKTLFKLSTGQEVPAEWRVSEALKKAQDNQKIGLGVYQELEGLDSDTAVANLRRASLDGSDMNTPATMLAKPLYWYGHLTRSLYRTATARNDRIAFLAGYLMKMKEGATFDDAYDFGVRVKENSMFGGGAASRPIGLFANSGKFYGAVGALYSLRHYTMSMFSDMYRMGHDSLASSGLPKEQMGAARKALTQMVVTQMAMAGAMGLPMVGGMMAVAEQLFPNLEVKKALREGLASLAGDDQEMGGLLADTFLKGVISASTPIDVSARFGLGDAFGLDPNKGFDPAQLFGVPGSLMTRMVTGVQEAATGNVGDAVKQFLPNAFGNITKLYNDDFKMRDKAGNLIYEPTDVELALSSIGFKPRKMAQFREEQALMERNDKVAARKTKDFQDGLASLMEQQRFGEVRAALMLKAETDDTYSARAGLRSVVETVLDRQLPKQLGETGPRGSIKSKEELAKTYPAQPPVSEMDRTLLRNQLEAVVGIGGAGHLTKGEVGQAGVVDYLMKLNPGMSRQHALLLAERLRARTPQ